jgi:hypothetical protein
MFDALALHAHRFSQSALCQAHRPYKFFNQNLTHARRLALRRQHQAALELPELAYGKLTEE